MPKSTLELIALSITKSKNPAICMVNTAKGGFSVNKSFLDKRGITLPEVGAYKFPEPTVVIVEHYAAGDNMYGYDEAGKPIPADRDSTTLDENGNPAYKKGDFPKWKEERKATRAFVSFAEWKAQHEMNKLMRELA